MVARDEGKFAPESGPQEEDDIDILHQMRDRDDDRAKAVIPTGKIDARPGAVKRAKVNEEGTKADASSKTFKRPQDGLTKEERLKIREKKSEKYHSQSGSQRGRERGQPNLGARMDLLLDKIKQG